MQGSSAPLAAARARRRARAQQGLFLRSPLQRLARFMFGGKVPELGRHVALVVLGENGVGDEGRSLKPSFRNRAGALAEEIRGDPSKNDRGCRLAIGQDEPNGHSVSLASD